MMEIGRQFHKKAHFFFDGFPNMGHLEMFWVRHPQCSLSVRPLIETIPLFRLIRSAACAPNQTWTNVPQSPINHS